MSHRTLKRVPLDFDWPLDKVWKGYINPYNPVDCPACERSGCTPEAKFLSDSWYRHKASEMFGYWYGANILAVPDASGQKRMGWSQEVIDNVERARRFSFKTLTNWSDKLDQEDVQALVDGGRLWDFMRTFVPGEGWKDKDPKNVPTADQVNIWGGRGMGHDSINQGICVKARCKRHNVEVYCPRCEGDGVQWPDPIIKKRHDAWKDYEPPKGKGWQLWETVSEGSPMSPVFKTADELAEWCAKKGAMGPGSKLSKEQCLRLMHDVEKLETGSMMIGSDDGIKLQAEREFGKPNPKDWSPSPK